jgi:hypothetical protein
MNTIVSSLVLQFFLQFKIKKRNSKQKGEKKVEIEIHENWFPPWRLIFPPTPRRQISLATALITLQPYIIKSQQPQQQLNDLLVRRSHVKQTDGKRKTNTGECHGQADYVKK